MELYYAIMNILNYMALNDVSKQEETNLFLSLTYLKDASGHTIEDIADANDCGECHTWREVVEALKELFESGERG